VSKNKAQQKHLENTLLRELAGASGNILDNTELIATLESCKTAALEIEKKLAQAARTTIEINEARTKYVPAAKRGSILFFSMTGLSGLNPMYETSLGSFLGVFNMALQRAKRDMDLQVRLDNILKTLTQLFYDFMCYGLFENHKLMFSFNMCIRILLGNNEMNAQLLDFFLRGNTSLADVASAKPNTWMLEQGWKDLLQLASISSRFKDVPAHVKSDDSKWCDWYNLEAPEKGELPASCEDLDAFERMCLVKCFRPDRIQDCVTQFVIQKIGEGYVQPPVLNFNHVLKMSSPNTPVVFILSPGADPAYSIFELADIEGMSPPKLKYVSRCRDRHR
jgi:dynein heavy chain